jgi:hypothetical protein
MIIRPDSSSTARHEQLIHTLARESRAPVEHVRALFEEEHAKLHASARVKTFVAVIATRLVRNALHEQRQSAN